MHWCNNFGALCERNWRSPIWGGKKVSLQHLTLRMDFIQWKWFILASHSVRLLKVKIISNNRQTGNVHHDSTCKNQPRYCMAGGLLMVIQPAVLYFGFLCFNCGVLLGSGSIAYFYTTVISHIQDTLTDLNSCESNAYEHWHASQESLISLWILCSDIRYHWIITLYRLNTF